MIYTGDKKTKKCYLGDDSISRVYLTNAGLIRSMTGCCTTVSWWTTGPHGTIRRLPSAVPA